MQEVVWEYCQWNKALYEYFFPEEGKDAILYLDENVIKTIALQANIQEKYGQTLEELFLSSTLISREKIRCFGDDKLLFKGCSDKLLKVKKWDQLVDILRSLKFSSDNVPAYFGMLCSIMYLASKVGANHREIKLLAKKYLGDDYSKKPGELVEPLLQQLHKDNPGFNANRMICGTQRHMSRIKYHLVLKTDVRNDFIDFLEINNLKWEYETYDFFINNILVPALDKAKKHNLIDFVIKQENISYVKNILRSSLRFGKPAEESTSNNIIQEKLIKWKYALEFDFKGDASFYIVCDFNNTPFCIEYDDDTSEFQVNEDIPFSELIASNVELEEHPVKRLKTNQYGSYLFGNVNEGVSDWKSLYFEKINEDYYLQVDEPNEGKDYLIFNRKGCRNNREELWTRVELSNISKYDVFEASDFHSVRRKTELTKHLHDSYKLTEVGSWFSIFLGKDQTIFWSPSQLNGEEVQITNIIEGVDGKAYFRIPPSNGMRLVGDLIVRDGSNDVLTEQISYGLEWNGEEAFYHMNGWGEITNEKLNHNKISNHTEARRYLQKNLFKQKTVGSDILLQTLYDLADSKGCVSSRKMVSALDFVLAFNGIIPTTSNKKSIIYALRRLGYMIAYYDVDKKEYVNQLLSKYVEKSNYSIDNNTNAYLIKGTYCADALEELLRNENGSYKEFRRKRPFDVESTLLKPEYKCLPDMILFNPKGKISWKQYDFQMSDYLISIMENMSGFEEKYINRGNGDLYIGQITQDLPCVVNDGQGNELLCTKSPTGAPVIHKYYNDGNHRRLIPRQLSRLYSQNKKGKPVCLMNWDYYNKEADYAKLSFVKGMGLPEVLDIALCDSNLGMPDNKDVFIINQKEIGVETPNPVWERRVYKTNATDQTNHYVLEAIKKMSGRNITSVESSPSVVAMTYSVNKYYSFKRIKKYYERKDLLMLYYGSDLIAFSIGLDAYYYDPHDKCFRKIIGEDVNYLLSKVYRNQIKDLEFGDVFNHAFDIKNNEIEIIPIVDLKPN